MLFEPYDIVSRVVLVNNESESFLSTSAARDQQLVYISFESASHLPRYIHESKMLLPQAARFNLQIVPCPGC
jgi:hypothetical protein